MNWERYKEKYFFEGVKNYDEINKALLFQSDFSETAQLFQKITTQIILSEDYSDENIYRICCEVFESINQDINHITKRKFINAWNTFNKTLGIGIKKIKKSVKTPDDEIANLMRNFNKDDRTTILKVDEYGLAGHYIISALENLDFPFEMAVDITRMLLEDYPILLPENVQPLTFKNKRKKWSKLYQTMLDKKLYVIDKRNDRKSKVSFVDVTDKTIPTLPDSKMISPFIRSSPTNNPTVIISNAPKTYVPKMAKLQKSSQRISNCTPAQQFSRKPERRTNLSQTNNDLVISKPNEEIIELPNSLHLLKNVTAPQNVPYQMPASKSVNKLTMLLASAEFDNQLKDELERLRCLDNIPQDEVVHNSFRKTSFNDIECNRSKAEETRVSSVTKSFDSFYLSPCSRAGSEQISESYIKPGSKACSPENNSVAISNVGCIETSNIEPAIVDTPKWFSFLLKRKSKPN